MTTVVTGFSPKGLIEYGANFMETFDQYWPKSVKLRCYVEQATDVPRNGERSLWDCRGMKEFIERNAPNPQRTGKAAVAGWGPKSYTKGYNFRFDAVKFSRQCFIPENASLELADGEVLAWFDGDVMTFRPVPEGFVEGLLKDFDLCYLGRVNTHTELGFWAVRLNQNTRGLLSDLAAIYRSDAIFREREWHSAFAFDIVRQRRERKDGLKSHNLTPRGMGHVWFQSPLANFTDHLKGERRKAMGRSMERQG